MISIFFETLCHKTNSYCNSTRYKGSFDVLHQIYKVDGLSGWYHGLLGTVLGAAYNNFAYFFWYSFVRGTYVSYQKQSTLSTITELLLGAFCAALSQLFTVPVGVINTRQQVSGRHTSVFHTIEKVYLQDGVTGFWRGFKPSLILVVNPSITYATFQRLKTTLFSTTDRLSPIQLFVLGAMAKALATIITHPLIVAKVMQQNGGNETKFNSFVDVLRYLLYHDGFLGLYKGLGPQITKGVMVQGLLFMFRDQIEQYIITAIHVFQAYFKYALV